MTDFEKIKATVDFIDGPKIEIGDSHSENFLVELYEDLGGEWGIIYSNHEFKPFMWYKYLRKFRTKWRVNIWGIENFEPVLLFQHTYNEQDKKILLRFDSPSYDVNYRWLLKAESFGKSTGSEILVSSKFHDRLRKNYSGSVQIIEQQKDFIGYCETNGIYASYDIGKHDIQSNMWDFWESGGIFENHASYYASWHHPQNWIGLSNEDLFDNILGL